MSLQRVTANSEDLWKGVGLSLSELKERLTPKFDWDYAVSSVVRRKTTLDEMVKQNVVYAVHFPYLDEITNVPDITNKHKKRKLKKATSPIALFVSVKTSEGKPYELKPVAIQVDNFHDSPVYTPADGRRWLLAKQLYQIADFAYVEMIEHLLKTHMVLQPICVTAKRTISVFHPLNELLKWHCRGLISTNVNGFPKLILPGNYMHLLFSMGHRGSIELLNKGFLDLSWEDIDFWKSIKVAILTILLVIFKGRDDLRTISNVVIFQKRGVDDTEKLPYFPYRDDGYLIWQQIQNYVEEYVSLYYNEDEDVSSDSELENFTNELSVDGIGQFGGVGMLRGFPSRIHTKTDLIQTLSRILWLPIQHNAVNYPIAYYGAFVPNMPTKLYDDPRAKTDEYSFYTLPDRGVATIQAVVSTSLGSLRFDNLLDYGAQMLDREAGELVEKHHKILMTKVKAIIEKRNDKRFNDGHLTYPYLKPGWIPNSIHT
ncbi:arachidonate 5-lipoxygenase-like isoform X2 [Dendronephthya gigantea]|uniref:arachidonate 5-lipoxygenase-like isoform X2 n=1 Tax=Dendronephthya gigantea TaxID=151771 RepID=UPI00106B7FB5|nr:arachidonate 5-lipoxygenase-like isoform X2 [Dendronephthya gigantea]